MPPHGTCVHASWVRRGGYPLGTSEGLTPGDGDTPPLPKVQRHVWTWCVPYPLGPRPAGAGGPVGCMACLDCTSSVYPMRNPGTYHPSGVLWACPPPRGRGGGYPPGRGAGVAWSHTPCMCTSGPLWAWAPPPTTSTRYNPSMAYHHHVGWGGRAGFTGGLWGVCGVVLHGPTGTMHLGCLGAPHPSPPLGVEDVLGGTWWPA
jgi:hypothetical protein